MAKPEIIVGLDVGTSKVAFCVGQISEGLTHVIGVSAAPNHGMRRGVVIDVEEVVSAISAALEEAERISSVPIESVWAGVGGSHITSTMSKGIIAVSRADNVISENDVERVLDASRAIALPPNQEILHVIPQKYLVDGQQETKDPIGMSGIRLETETIVIGGQTTAIKNLSKAVYQAGLEIEGLIYAPIATAQGLLTKREKETGVMLLDIGAGTTSLAIFEEGELIHAKILPVGSMHITNDLAIGLKTSLETAEQIKIKFGTANARTIKENENLDLTKIAPDEPLKVKRKEIAEIIDARLKELFQLVRAELKLIHRDALLPAGAVLTGGGSQLDSLSDYLKGELHLPVKLGTPVLEIAGLIDRLDNPSLSTAMGLMLYGETIGHGYPGTRSTKTSPTGKKITSLFDQAREFLRQLLP